MEKQIINKPGKEKIRLQLSEEGKRIEWTGIVYASEPEEYELDLVMEHTVPRTYGRVTIMGVVENGAKLRIGGLLKIAKAAQGTDSFLSIRILVLDRESVVVTRPELEIEANEVKAGHAVTVGKIDEEQMSYLKSRGLDEPEAKRLIIKGFLEDNII